jgi:hypothetical protein
MILMMIEDRGDDPVDVGSDMVVSMVENDSLMQCSVMDGRGMGTDSRKLTAGVDGNSGAGMGLDGMARLWRGRAWWKIRLVMIQVGGTTRVGLSAMRTVMWRLG